MVSQNDLNHLKGELKGRFEPFGARVEEIELQMSDRIYKWRSWVQIAESQDGSWTKWESSDPAPPIGLTVFIVEDPVTLRPENEEQRRQLFDRGAGEWRVPSPVLMNGIWDVLREIVGEPLPPITVRREAR